MTIEELQEKMQSVVAKADAESRSLNDDEVSEYEGYEKQLTGVRRDIELRKRHIAYQNPATSAVQTADRKDSDELDRAFESYLRTGQRNSDLVELRAQQEASSSAGGYLVPDTFRAKLIERMKSFGGFAKEAEQLNTTSGNPIGWPTLDDTANAGEIVPESATGSAGADIVVGTASLGAYKYMSLGAGNLPLRVSVELLQDSAFDIVSLLTRVMGKRIARAQARDFVMGSGSGEPLGINHTVPDQHLATANPVTYAKLLAAVHGIDPDYRDGGAKWLMNDATLATLQGMVDGNQRPLWLPTTDGLSGNLPGGQLLGYPVVIDQAMPNIGNSTSVEGDGAVIFGDLIEAYVIRRVKDVTLVVDPYGRAANGEVQFTAWARADGTIQDRNAYVVLAGFAA